MSRRGDIVNAITKALEDGEITDACHFFKNPFRETSQDELPCLKIGFLTETDSRENTHIEYKRVAELVVAYVTQDNGDKLTDTLYTMAERLERFLINEENLTQFGGITDDVVQKSTDFVYQNAEIGMGAAVLKFDLTYWTQHPPELGPLERIGVKIKPTTAPEEDPPLFEEVVTLPQP